MLMTAAVIFALAAPITRGDYTENFQTWSAANDATWETKDLSGAPFNVAANAVVEIAVYNIKNNAARQGGVRAVGSSLARFFDLMEAENGGSDVVVMHVQADSTSSIQHYAEKKADITFVLLGSWCGPTYVEKFTSFTAGADATWSDENLNAYGVSANEIAEIVMVNKLATGEREAGVRLNGSSLQRKLNLHESEGDGGTSENGTMFVKADGTANATVEIYAQVDADVDFYIVGYWSTPPGSYTQLFADIGSPATDITWTDVDLTASGLPDGAIAEIVLTNQFATMPNEMGVRPNGSSLARLLDLQEAEDGGEDAGRMHVTSDATATIEFYHEDVSEAHRFLLTGYWDSLTSFLLLADHAAGQETNAFGSCPGTATDAELFAFNLDTCGASISVTQLVFRLTSITGIVDGDWDEIEIIEDTNNDGNIGAGETTARGGTGVVSTSGGTITFATSFTVSSNTNYILRADVSSLATGDTVTIGLASGDVTSAATENGTTTSVVHTVSDDLSAGMDFFGTFNDGSGSTATDSSGNNNDGTVTNASWTDGIHGGALSFDGSGDYVDIPTTIGSTTAGSISFWFITSTDFSSDAIMYYGSDVGTGNGGGTENELHVNFTSTETVQFFIEGTPDVSITSSGTYADGAWHNVLATWDITGNAVLYIDGTSIGSATHDADSFSFSSTHRVARPGANSNLFTGRMDGVRLYTTALASDAATTLSRGFGLVGHWKMDDGSGPTAIDSTGNADGTLQNGPIWGAGKLCDALDFDGDNDHITFPHNADMSLTSFTLTAWVNTDTVAGGLRMIFSKGTSANDWNYWLAMIGDEIQFGFYNGSNWPAYTTSSNLAVDTWYHFAASFDNTTDEIFLYLNGVEVLSDSTTDTPVTNTQAGWIGTDQENKDWNGQIDDVRIYNRALTPAEIRTLAATYGVEDLGSLSTGQSLGFSINDSEQIAGHDENTSNGDPSAWSSRFGEFTALGTLTGGSIAESLGINNAGKIVGWSDDTAGDRKAFLWTSGGGMTDLGTLGGRDDSQAGAINASDEVVGYALNFGDGPPQPPKDRLAFFYLPVAAHTLPMGINSLGTLGGAESLATDVNDSGEVVGGAQVAGGNMRPFTWTDGTMTNLGTLGGENRSIVHRAHGINSSGEIVGLSYTAGDAKRAFLYLPVDAYGLSAGMNDLGVLTGGSASWAFAINDDGEVVGTSDVTGGAYHAFIWANGTMSDLNDLIDTSSAWVLTRATDINDDGEIVGWGTNPCSDVHAFVLTQTCAASSATGGAGTGGPGTGDPGLGGGSGVTDGNGEFEQIVVSSEGEQLAEIVLVANDAGVTVEFTITGPAPNSSGGPPGPIPGTWAGFDDGVALGRTLALETSAPPGGFQVTVSMTYTTDELAELGIDPQDVELHVLDPTQGSRPGVWIPAGTNVGETAPTGILDESGFVVYTDGTVDYWAIRDTQGIFAVGRAAGQRDSGPEPPDDDDSTPGDPPRPPGLCGIFMLQPLFVSGVILFVQRARRRRCRTTAGKR